MQKTTSRLVPEVGASASTGPWIAAILALGVMAVVLVALVSNRSARPNAPSSTEETSAEQDTPARRETIPTGAQTAGAPARNHPQQSAAIEAPLPLPDRGAATPSDPATEMAVVRERHQSALEQHAREPADPQWAQEMSAIVGRGLKAGAAKGEFTVLDVDCRSRTCVASVEWESASTAYGQWNSILRENYGRCGVEVVLDDPNQVTGHFGTKILFPCEHQE